MPLDSQLVSKLGVTDIFPARILVRDGFVEVNGQIITRPDLPVSTQDTIQITDARLARMPRGYFMLRELQSERDFFGSTTDALCIGTDRGALAYLREKRAAVANASPEASGIGGVKDIITNPLTEKISAKHAEKFNFIIFGPRFGIFTVFGILENNSNTLLSRGRALLELRKDEPQSQENISKFAEGAGFSVESIMRFDIEPESGWIILKKK